MSDTNLLNVTDDNFDEVIASGLTMIDFSATWCGPCRMIAPIVEQLAEQYAGRVRIGKLDVDECPQATRRMGIRSVPSILFFKDGAHVDTVLGAVPKQMLERKIESLL